MKLLRCNLATLVWGQLLIQQLIKSQIYYPQIELSHLGPLIAYQAAHTQTPLRPTHFQVPQDWPPTWKQWPSTNWLHGIYRLQIVFPSWTRFGGPCLEFAQEKFLPIKKGKLSSFQCVHNYAFTVWLPVPHVSLHLKLHFARLERGEAYKIMGVQRSQECIYNIL